MSTLVHRIYIGTLTAIVVLTALFLVYNGASYYSTVPSRSGFITLLTTISNPAGLFGHGLGIMGTLLILIGVTSYIARKRYGFLSRFGRLKYWLEFHIFLCSLGPVMILFHTAFKFGGIVSIAFWSMVAVVASGVIGRFIYIQIPRTIEGRYLRPQRGQGDENQPGRRTEKKLPSGGSQPVRHNRVRPDSSRHRRRQPAGGGMVPPIFCTGKRSAAKKNSGKITFRQKMFGK
ncbi:MAG: hypothetical protein H6559_12490 [Lewinellaceae bacterium]|nr:hypothetical protein [Lewinellaceae bacterium]